MLTNVNILNAIEERRKEILKRNDVTADRIIQEYAKIAFLSSDDVFNWDVTTVELDDGNVVQKAVPILKPHEEMSDAALASIQSIEDTKFGVKIKMYSKKDALEALGRYIGVENDAQINKAKRIKEADKAKEITDPLEGMTVEQIEREIEELRK